jgi:hypothetical protein
VNDLQNSARKKLAALLGDLTARFFGEQIAFKRFC